MIYPFPYSFMRKYVALLHTRGMQVLTIAKICEIPERHARKIVRDLEKLSQQFPFSADTCIDFGIKKIREGSDWRAIVFIVEAHLKIEVERERIHGRPTPKIHIFDEG